MTTETKKAKPFKNLMAGAALCVAVLLGAAACSPEELKYVWDSNGTDYSHKSEQDIAIEAFYWTLWQQEQEALNRYAWAIDNGGLERLRACESGGNYAIVSPAGYYGAYQFSQQTWNYVANKYYGGKHAGVRPNLVESAWQDAFTRALWSELGRQPWPVCGRRV